MRPTKASGPNSKPAIFKGPHKDRAVAPIGAAWRVFLRRRLLVPEFGARSSRALCFQELKFNRQCTDNFPKPSTTMLRTKFITIVTLSYLIGQLHAETALSEATGIPGQITDGTPSKPAVKAELPAFKVKQSIVRQMNVVEAPEMPGLPPVKGRINVTV